MIYKEKGGITSMKKRILSILCALTMALSLAACGGGSGQEAADTSTDNATASTEASGDTIRFAVSVPLTGDNAEQ